MMHPDGMNCTLLRVDAAELEAYRHNSELLALRLQHAEEDPYIYDIDKSWDGIIYLLTGSSSSDTSKPLSRLIFSMNLVDEQQQLGAGPAHYLMPPEVRELNNLIKDIVPEQLRERFDAGRMLELGIYPKVWQHEAAADYLIEYFETIQEVFAAAAAADQAIVTLIT
jgi:hypothetical protein